MQVIRISKVTTELMNALANAGVEEESLGRLRSGEGILMAFGLHDEAMIAATAYIEQYGAPSHRGRPKTIDDETLARARELMAGGETMAAAARILGVDDSTLSRAIGPIGIRRGRERALSPEQIETARRLRTEQWSNQRIADELGCGEATVRRVLKAGGRVS